MSDDLISRNEVIKGINELMKSPYANSKEFGFELGFARREAMEMVKSLCVNGLFAAYDTDAVLSQLHNAGGCDGSTEYARGWDDAMEEAERIVAAGLSPKTMQGRTILIKESEEK